MHDTIDLVQQIQERLASGLRTNQDPIEIAWLIQHLCLLQPHTRGLEIGTAHYGATLLLQEFTGAHITTIDITPHRPSSNRHIFFIQGDSTDPQTIHRVAALGPYDFLFIDGNHHPNIFLQDFANYPPLVRPGGLIAIHDISSYHKVKSRGAKHCQGIAAFWTILKSLNIPLASIENSFGIGLYTK